MSEILTPGTVILPTLEAIWREGRAALLDRSAKHAVEAAADLVRRAAEGQEAVAQIVLNRVRHPASPDSICGVVYQGSARASDGGALQGRVAMMAQADLLMPWLSVRENVMLGARLRGLRGDVTRATELLQRVGLEALAARKPRALSGGQRQRAALARTLYEDRPVVLLDEPFSALDVATRARMQELAAEVLRGRTVLHVTHDPAEAARLGERVFVLTGQELSEVAVEAPAPIPRAPDAGETLAVTGRLTRLLLDAA